MDADLSENEPVHLTLTMWKTFHNSIMVMYNRLNDSDDLLEMLINFLLKNSKSFPDILVPKTAFDHTGPIVLRKEDYQSFTVWLFSRLFYILTEVKLVRIHNIVIDSQLKILDTLKQHYLCSYEEVIENYTNILKQLNDYSRDGKALIIDHFRPLVETLPTSELLFKSMKIEVASSEKCHLIQKNICPIMFYILNLNLQTSLCNDKFVMNIWSNLICLLENCDFQLKFVIVKQMVCVYRSHWSKIDQFHVLRDHMLSILKLSESLLKNFQSPDNGVVPNSVYNDLVHSFLDWIVDCNIVDKMDSSAFLVNVVESRVQFLDKATVKLFLKFVRSDRLEKLIEFKNDYFPFMDKVSPFVILIIKNNIKNYLLTKKSSDSLINLPEIESVWKQISDRISKNIAFFQSSSICDLSDFSLVHQKFSEILRCLEIAFYLQFEFHNQQNFNYFDSKWSEIHLIEIAKKCALNSSSHETNEILNVIVKITAISIFLKQTNSIAVSNLYLLVGFVTYPFLNEAMWTSSNKENNAKLGFLLRSRNASQNRHVENQLLTIDLLIICLFNNRSSETSDNIQKWALKIFNYCLKSTNMDILKKITICVPLMIVCLPKYTDEINKDILHSIVQKRCCQLEISQVMRIIFCITNASKVFVHSKNDSCLELEISCSICSVLSSHNCIEIENLQMPANVSQLIASCPKTFKSSDIEIRKSSIQLLISLLNHNFDLKSVNFFEIFVSLLNDSSLDVKFELAKYASVVFNCVDKLDLKFYDQCLEVIVDNSKRSLETFDSKFQEAVLILLKNLGSSSKVTQIANYFPVILKLLIYFIMSFNSRHSSEASVYFGEVLRAQNLSEHMVFNQYQKYFCQAIIDITVFNYLFHKTFNLSYSLQKIAITFNYSGVNEFISTNCQHLLPYLMIYITQNNLNLGSMLQDFANISSYDLIELITLNFGYIYSYVYLNESNEMFQKCLECMKKITNVETSSLIKRNLQVIHNELLLNYNEKSEKILVLLSNFSRNIYGTNAKHSTNAKINFTEVSDYLKVNLMGVLVSFDSKLLKKSISENIKKRILSSFADIIKMMGTKNITILRFKVLATLHTSLKSTNLSHQKLSLNAWKSFVEVCDKEALAPLMSTVVVSILPLIDVAYNDVVTIFNYLMIENYMIMKNYFTEIFFLLTYKIPESFKSVLRNSLKDYEQKSFLEKIQMFLKVITHENSEVRMNALKHTKTLLAENRNVLNELILCNNGINMEIVKLIDILVAGCRDYDTKLKVLHGDCLGELGAIEPSLLPQIYFANQEYFSFFMENDRFLSFLLTELTKFFQAETNTQNVNSFALAIQETLKIFDISSIQLSKKHEIWKQFPESMKEVLSPLLSSKYRVVNDGQDCDKLSHPLFGSKEITTYSKWVYSWIGRMINLVKNDRIRSLLKAYQPSFRKDNRIILIVLPHVILNILLDSPEKDKVLIFDEMSALLMSFKPTKYFDTSLAYLLASPKEPKSNTCQKPVQNLEEIGQIKCCKVVFVLLDFFDKWLFERRYSENASSYDKSLLEKANNNIADFLKKFNCLAISQCNFFCKEFSRSLLYLEKHCESNPDDFMKNLSFFEEIYANLNEPDGVYGVLSVKKNEPSLEELIIAHEVSGQFNDALLCYEKLLQENPNKIEYFKSIIKCYLELDNPLIANHLIKGKMKTSPELVAEMTDLEMETLWRLSKFEELGQFYENSAVSLSSWSNSIGKVLIDFKSNNRSQFKEDLDFIRSNLVDEIGMSSVEETAYEFGYPQILKLHIVNEIDKIENLYLKILEETNLKVCEEKIIDIEKELDLRLSLVQPTSKSIEPILCLRRIALSLLETKLQRDSNASLTGRIGSMIGKCWLKSAEVARLNGLYQQAYAYILNAERYNVKELFVEKAQLFWTRNDKDDAISVLKRGLKDSSRSVSIPENRRLIAEAELLFAIYNDKMANVDIDVNMKYFKKSSETFKEWEKNSVFLAQYYDKFYDTISNEDKEVRGSDLRIFALNYYGKSLCFGSNYIYQSMPRMLSIWLDYGKNSEAKKKETIKQMCTAIKNFSNRLPAFMFLTAFSQLSPRICHENEEVFQTLKNIIVMLILKYPHQTLWMFLAILKSSYTFHMKRSQEILRDANLRKNKNIAEFISEFNVFCDKLIELSNKKISTGVHTISLKETLPSLAKFFQNKTPRPIMMPIKKCMKTILPSTELTSEDYNPFPNEMIYIQGIDDDIQILMSMQKPRKIKLRGSDGKVYTHLLKAKDDLRKDSRVMDVNDVVSEYLRRNPDSRQRRLHINTYMVVPLNNECGLIEFVLNLVSFRSILMNIYSKKGIHISSAMIAKYNLNVSESLEEKRRVLVEKLLPMHPPVFPEWFRYTFSDPQSWFQARNAYIRTTAVMSMVGYMLGLGDRHGENILFDGKTGEIMHVDFSCIFDRGESLQMPEKVPFRLTHNMVKAMGPLGVEGLFRRACVITLRVLRTNSDILMSVVEPFIYDPLVSWKSTRELSTRPSNVITEHNNDQMIDVLKNVKLRLNGMIKSSKGKTTSISLSHEGQVDYLIKEAVNIDNLCQLFIGWGAYL